MIAAYSPRSILAALLGLAVVIVVLPIDARALLVTYLATVTAISAIAVGAIGVLMLTYLVRGNWTQGLHLPLTAAALTTPAAGLLFIPALIGISWIYPWTHETAGAPRSFEAIWLTCWF